jgi:nucleotide-binding universal stress UspA family protein
MLTFKRILVPVDGSSTSNKALGAAVELARRHQGQLRIIHSVDELQYIEPMASREHLYFK